MVLNQYKEGVGLTPRDVEDGLGHRLAFILGRDELRVLQSLNVGRPEVHSGKSRFAKEIMALGRDIAGPEAVVAPRKGLLGRFWRSSKIVGRSGKEAK